MTRQAPSIHAVLNPINDRFEVPSTSSIQLSQLRYGYNLWGGLVVDRLYILFYYNLLHFSQLIVIKPHCDRACF